MVTTNALARNDSATLPPARGTARSREQGLGTYAKRALLYLVLIALGIAFAVPMIWMISASLKPENEVLTVPPTFIPSTPQWGNYEQAGTTVLPFFWNSVKLAFLNVVFLLFFASLAGYGFARLEFRGKRVAFAALLSTAMIPGIIYLIPQYIMYRQIGWIDTHYPLWIPRVLTPVFGTFLLRQAFRVIPRELEEAARMDGASTFAIYWRIMLPQVKPALATVGVLTFIESWNDLFGPLIFLNSQELQTLPVALALFQGEYFTQTNLMMAAATISVLPPLILFAVAQKYFVQGITMTGLRG